MKQAQNPRRGRGRSGPGKRHQPSKNRNFESSGGETKVRGNAQQVLDKYQAMARDAASAGEHIQAEGYWQHAEHYYRILNVDKDDRPANSGKDGNQNNPANNGGNKPRTEQSNAREIPIETVADAPQDNGGESGSAEQPEANQPVRLTEPAVATPEPQAKEPVAQEPVAQEPAQEPAAEKPKRRGRPRKVAAETSDANDSSEKPDTDASPETVSA